MTVDVVEAAVEVVDERAVRPAARAPSDEEWGGEVGAGLVPPGEIGAMVVLVFVILEQFTTTVDLAQLAATNSKMKVNKHTAVAATKDVSIIYKKKGGENRLERSTTK